MEKRILLEKRGRSDDEITELILDNCRSTYIDGLTDSFTALETLSLINVGLVSLKNFPKLSNLRKLELSDNRISNGLNHLTGSPKLTHLNLSGNRIKDFDELQPLKDLENLEVLDLFNNQVTLIENYREKLFQLIPSLNYLDGFDKEYVEAPSDEEDMAEEEEPEDSCEESDEEEVSLAYLYNDNLEEDQEDWKSVESDYNNADEEFDSEEEEDEEGGGGGGGGGENEGEDGGDSDGEGEDEEGEEEEDGEDDADGSEAAASSTAAAAAEADESKSTATEAAAATSSTTEDVAKEGEPEARGKKRKFQGTDSDG
ncbi:acidic leucine-rich nuclear phosphoprotein 32 family member A isoform X3 [Anopheles arabiensis]|uniref:acidic leucine-rich nuclear phosphoprotein 32 family member A isoform X3 n=1 Tax=Anopheles arabiensis TaxID=7173 RepID=UPI001AADD60E|nr:acidic leucine-rich nuclear phosphoprotein 32 family member A isoform X3 [Anopheles arabiensis]